MKWYDKLRAQYVKRWHTVRLSHDQSLADHTFNVMIIALELAKRVGRSEEERGQILMQALEHDLNEVVTGDIPTPTKKRLSKDSQEHLSNGSVDRIVKVADAMETAFQIWQHGLGMGAHTGQVRNYVMDQLDVMFDALPDQLNRAVNDVWLDMLHGERDW